MKTIPNAFRLCLLAGLLIVIACQKDDEYQNKAPVAHAGVDQILYFPVNIARLDGSGSLGAEKSIVTYEWNKVGGPLSYQLQSKFTPATTVFDLEVGVYLFELKVADNVFLTSRDTVKITVYDSQTPSGQSAAGRCDLSDRPEMEARLVPVGRLSGARANMAVVSTKNLILFAGGQGPGAPEEWGSSKVDIYNLTTQTWSVAQLSKARYGVAAVANGDKIFLAGGQFGDGAFNQIFSTVDIFDTEKNSWSVQSLSEPRGYITAASIGNKVFFAGGEKDWDYKNTDRIDIYNLDSKAWNTNTLKEPRSYMSSFAAGDNIYFAGGQKDNRWYNQPSFAIDIYNQASNSWSQSNLRDPMGFVGGTVFRGKAYWANGCNVEVKDLSTGTSTFSNLFRQSSWYNSNGQNLVIKDNYIVFFGAGVFNDNKGFLERARKFDVLNVSDNTWSIGVLPQSLSGFSIISLNNKIYIAGGYVDNVLSDQVWTLEF